MKAIERGKARRSGTAASPWAVDVIGNRGKVQAAATYLKQKEKCRCEQVIFSTDTRISLYYSRFLLRFPAPLRFSRVRPTPPRELFGKRETTSGTFCCRVLGMIVSGKARG